LEPAFHAKFTLETGTSFLISGISSSVLCCFYA
jgi:hypothetical protein